MIKGACLTNKLAGESSPYLQQHADNPVDWHPWGDEALRRAKEEDRPILLSIGYAACHWCHVMAHESFENAETAQVMNEHFINVKVDREERPDIDSIYMQAVQAMTGHGGWPMTMFLLPDGTPFYGGTYFPPEDRHGLPSFRRVLDSVAKAFSEQRESLTRSGGLITGMLRKAGDSTEAAETPTAQTLELAYRTLARGYDVTNAGFGVAPKFPPTMSLEFLLRYWSRTKTAYALQMVEETFQRMTRGGIYDQVGGGMARYSVDARWLVPHFEKMLYDNALLIRLGASLWQATKNSEVRIAVERTIEWTAREMTSPEGGFYSSLDADSEGEEGRFYLWSGSEIDELLGEDAATVKSYYGITPGGNFEGRSILFVAAGRGVTASRSGITVEELDRIIESARGKLYDARSRRVWPARDEKILAGWNGLMLRAIATANRVFGRTEWSALALSNARFLRDRMLTNGRLTRSYKDGRATIPGFLEDHASVALGFIATYELTSEESWLRSARAIAEAILAAFWSADDRKMYDTAGDAEQLIVRPRDVSDNAIPSGSSLAAELFLQLGDLFDDAHYREVADAIIDAAGAVVARYAAGFGHLLCAIDLRVNGATQVALVGEPSSPDFLALQQVLATRYVPALLLAAGDGTAAESDIALLRGRRRIDDGATAYVCRGYVCDAPITDSEVLAAKLSTG